MKSEVTSRRIATIAGKVLANIKNADNCEDDCTVTLHGTKICSMGELSALAASCLTQAPGKVPSKRKAVKK